MAVDYEELLLKLLQTRLRTSFIYAIAELEEEFGYLWGHDKDDDEEFTENEMIFYEKYQNFRKRVLDNGNNQIRYVINDLRKCGATCHNPNYVEFRPEKEIGNE